MRGLARPHHRLRRADLCDRCAGRRRQDPASARLRGRAARATTSSCATSRARPIATPIREGRWAPIGLPAPGRSDAHRLSSTICATTIARSGFSEEEVAEFDSVETIDQLAGALEALGCDGGARGAWAGARRAARRRRSLRPRVLHRRGREGPLARGAGAGALRAVRPALSVLRPADDAPPRSTRPWPSGSCATRACRRLPSPWPQASASELAGWSHFPAFVKPLAEGTGKGCEAASLGASSRASSRRRRRGVLDALCASRRWSSLTCRAASSPSASSAMAPTRTCSASARSCCKSRPRPMSIRCTIRSCARSWSSTPAPTTRGAARRRTRALAAYRALGVPGRGAHRFPLRCARASPISSRPTRLPGLNPHHSDLPILAAQNGVAFVELIGMILDAGLARYGLPTGQPGSRGGDVRDGAGSWRLRPGPACGDEDRPDEIDTLVAAEAVAGRVALARLCHRDYRASISISASSRRCRARRPSPRLQPGRRSAGRRPARADDSGRCWMRWGSAYTGAHTGAWLETLSKIATKLKLAARRPAHAGLVG